MRTRAALLAVMALGMVAACEADGSDGLPAVVPGLGPWNCALEPPLTAAVVPREAPFWDESSEPASAAVRAEVRSILTPYEPPAVDLEVRDESYLDDGAILRQELRYTTADGERAFAVMLRPADTVVRPAVLVLHGHDASSEHLTEPQDRYCRGLALELTRAGFVTLSPDVRSFGAFKPGGKSHWGSDGYAMKVREDGDVYARLAANDARVSLAVLRAAPGVDPDRMGVAGISLGSLLALLTAIAEPDLKAIVLSNLLVPFDVFFTDEHHHCQHLLALADVGDVHELAASLLPRAVQVQWGANDKIYNEDGGDTATAALEALAMERGFSDRLSVHIIPELGHAFEPPVHTEFFRQHLMPEGLHIAAGPW